MWEQLDLRSWRVALGCLGGASLIGSFVYAAQNDCPPQNERSVWRFQMGDLGGPLSELLQLLFYLIIALLIAFALYTLFRWLLGRPPRAETSMLGLFESTQATPPDLLRAAEEQAAQGNYRLALRHLQTAALVHLDRLGFLTYEPTNTDWEHLRALRDHGQEALHAQLLPLTELVQRKWYGLEEAAPEDFHKARQAIQPILARQGAS